MNHKKMCPKIPLSAPLKMRSLDMGKLPMIAPIDPLS